jgi:hypothetical protein
LQTSGGSKIYGFSAVATVDHVLWDITLVIEHHRGYRGGERVGWQVKELVFKKRPESGADEDEMSLTFKHERLETMRTLRIWLTRFRDESLFNTLTAYPSSSPQQRRLDDPDASLLKALLRLDEDLKPLEKIPNEPDKESSQP